MRTATLVSVLLLPVTVAAAQSVPPSLVVGEGAMRKALALSEVDVRTRIHGRLAETTMTMTFANSQKEALEGDLLFPLPPGATVCGYGLDIDGKMVDGVVIEKERGAWVYETIVSRRIDPGLLEWVEGDTFRTRVFPIPPEGRRTVSVTYVTELAAGADGPVYRLPLNFEEPVGTLGVRLEVVRADGKPEVVAGEVPHLTFAKRGRTFVAEATVEGLALTEDLVVALAGESGRQVAVEKAPDGAMYFCISNPLGPASETPSEAKPRPPRRVAVLWDGSGSRAHVDHRRELAFLRDYFAELKPATVEVELVVFRHKTAEPARVTLRDGDATPLLALVEDVAYDGGTRLEALSAWSPETKPDVVLLFTDGIATLGEAVAPRFGAPVYVFSTSGLANRVLLRYVALATGGGYFELRELAIPEAVGAFAEPKERFLGVEVVQGEVSGLTPRFSAPADRSMTIAGRLETDEATVRIKCGRAGRATRQIDVEVASGDAAAGGLLRYVWARKRIAEILADPHHDAAEVARLGMQYAVVTPYTSLIVLESLEQYVEFRVRPPATLPEMREAYDEAVGVEVVRGESPPPAPYDPHANPVYPLLLPWYYRIGLWEEEYEYSEGFRYEGDVLRPVAAGGVAPHPGPGEPVVSEAAVGFGAGGGGLGDLFGGGGPGFDITAVTHGARDLGGGGGGFGDMFGIDPRGPTPVVTYPVQDLVATVPGFSKPDVEQAPSDIVVVQPGGKAVPVEDSSLRIEVGGEADRELGAGPSYLRALEAAPPGQGWATYLAARREHAAVPRFFVEAALFFLRRGDREAGVQVLSNLAEVGMVEPMRTAAYRLLEVDMPDLAQTVLEEVVRLCPEEPQAYLDLAAALERQGRTERAVELLHTVATERRTGRWWGVRIPVLVEMNRLLRRLEAGAAKRLGIDRRLVRTLDYDLRVVAIWNADQVDIDLGVVEPSGERCFYEHAATTIGGQLWLDVAGKRGPEEYTIRRAMPGTYKIELRYEQRLAPRSSDPILVRVDVYTDYARPGERRETFTCRLRREGETVTVTEVELPRQPGTGGREGTH